MEIAGQITNFLLDHPDDLELGGGAEVKAFLADESFEITGDVASSNVDSHDAVRHGETFVNRHGVGDAIAGIEDDSRHTAGRIQTEHGLHGHEQCGNVECFEEDFRRFLAVLSRVEGRFCQ